MSAVRAASPTVPVIDIDSEASMEDLCGDRRALGSPLDPKPPQQQDDPLMVEARQADARNWLEHKRPISAETLFQQLEVSAERARDLVAAVRAELAKQLNAVS